MNQASHGIKLSTFAIIVCVMTVSAFFNTANADLKTMQQVTHQDDVK